MPIAQLRMLRLIEAAEKYIRRDEAIYDFISHVAYQVATGEIDNNTAFGEIVNRAKMTRDFDSAARNLVSEERHRYNITHSRNALERERQRIHREKHYWPDNGELPRATYEGIDASNSPIKRLPSATRRKYKPAASAPVSHSVSPAEPLELDNVEDRLAKLDADDDILNDLIAQDDPPELPDQEVYLTKSEIREGEIRLKQIRQDRIAKGLPVDYPRKEK
jgi:hypothetical protein